MKKQLFGFEKLTVWQKARDFVVALYVITDAFPEKEKFGLQNQIRRAAISIAANIAEGTSRISKKDQAHFTQLAYSSLMEVVSHLCLTHDIRYISMEKLDENREKAFELSAMLNALRKSQLR